MSTISSIFPGIGAWFIFSFVLNVVFMRIERRVLKEEDPYQRAGWPRQHPSLAALEDGSEQYGQISRRALPWGIASFCLGLAMVIAA